MSITQQDIIDMTEGLRKTKRKDWESPKKLKGDSKIIEDWLEQEDAHAVSKLNNVSSSHVYKVITKNGLI